MNGGVWADPNARAIAIYLDGSDDPDRAQDGTFMVDDDFLVLVNSWWEPLDFVVSQTRPGARWQPEIDTYDPAEPGGAAGRDLEAGGRVTVGPRSIVVLEEYLRRTTRGFACDAPKIRASSSQIGGGPRQGDANGPRPELTTHVMSEAEALEVLGLRPDAEASEIIEAHRRVMQIVHPDRGGSKYFAVKANQAKDVLLNRLRPQSESSATTAPRKRRRRDRDQRDLSEPRSAIGE